MGLRGMDTERNMTETLPSLRRTSAACRSRRSKFADELPLPEEEEDPMEATSRLWVPTAGGNRDAGNVHSLQSARLTFDDVVSSLSQHNDWMCSDHA